MSEDRAVIKETIRTLYDGDSLTLKQLQEYADKYPGREKYFDFSIMVESDRDYGQCCPSTRTHLQGHRYENEYEKAHRLKEEARKAKEEAKLAKFREKHEKKMLVELLKKYPQYKK